MGTLWEWRVEQELLPPLLPALLGCWSALDELNEAALRHQLRLLDAMPDLALASHLLRARSDSRAPLPPPASGVIAARGRGVCAEAEGDQLPRAQERARAAHAWGAEPSRTFASAIASLVALRSAAGPATQLHLLLEAQEQVVTALAAPAALGRPCGADDLVPAMQFAWVRGGMYRQGGCSLGRLRWLQGWHAAQGHAAQGRAARHPAWGGAAEYAFCTSMLVVQHLLHSDLAHQTGDRGGWGGEGGEGGAGWVTWGEAPPAWMRRSREIVAELPAELGGLKRLLHISPELERLASRLWPTPRGSGPESHHELPRHTAAATSTAEVAEVAHAGRGRGGHAAVEALRRAEGRASRPLTWPSLLPDTSLLPAACMRAPPSRRRAVAAALRRWLQAVARLQLGWLASECRVDTARDGGGHETAPRLSTAAAAATAAAATAAAAAAAAEAVAVTARRQARRSACGPPRDACWSRRAWLHSRSLSRWATTIASPRGCCFSGWCCGGAR